MKGLRNNVNFSFMLIIFAILGLFVIQSEATFLGCYRKKSNPSSKEKNLNQLVEINNNQGKGHSIPPSLKNPTSCVRDSPQTTISSRSTPSPQVVPKRSSPIEINYPDDESREAASIAHLRRKARADNDQSDNFRSVSRDYSESIESNEDSEIFQMSYEPGYLENLNKKREECLRKKELKKKAEQAEKEEQEKSFYFLEESTDADGHIVEELVAAQEFDSERQEELEQYQRERSKRYIQSDEELEYDSDFDGNEECFSFSF